jgi:hypothetical protein
MRLDLSPLWVIRALMPNLQPRPVAASHDPGFPVDSAVRENKNLEPEPRVRVFGASSESQDGRLSQLGLAEARAVKEFFSLDPAAVPRTSRYTFHARAAWSRPQRR